MSTNREKIAHIISATHEVTFDDLMDASDMDRKRMANTINDLLSAELIERFKDDVTGQPAYRMAEKGRAWLVNRPVVASHATNKAVRHEPQPEVGQNTGSQRVATSPVVPPVTALAAEQSASVVVSVTADAGSEIGYCVLAVDKDGLHKTPDEAMRAAVGRSNLEDMAVCEIRPIGRIAMQPVMVPMP